MEYELARALKDAGFPQTRADGALKGTYLFPEGVSLRASKRQMADAMVYEPPLEELIEACGVRFDELCQLGEGDKYQWYATDKDDAEIARHYGSTPTEAVARLWLALEKI